MPRPPPAAAAPPPVPPPPPRPPSRPCPAGTAAAGASCAGSGGALHRYGEVRRDRVEVEGLADEVAERDDEVVGVDRVSGDQLARGALGEAHLLLGAEQDDVRQRRLDGVADLPGALRAEAGGGEVDGIRPGRVGRAAAEVADVRRVDGQRAGEGAAEGLVGGDQHLEPFVDLPVGPLAALLDGGHDHEADADADQRDQRQRQDRREQAAPGAEVEIAHADQVPTGARWSWPASSRASQVDLRGHAGAGAGEPPARAAVAGPAGGGGEVPAGLDAGGAAAAGGEEERERCGAALGPGLAGEVQPANRGEAGGIGELDHHQRHEAGAQGFLGGPEQLEGGAGAAEDQAGGIEEAADAVAHQPVGGPGRLQPEHGSLQPACGQEGEDRPGGAGRLVGAGAGELDAGGEDEAVGGGGMAGLEHGVRRMFSGSPPGIKPPARAPVRPGGGPSARRTPRR